MYINSHIYIFIYVCVCMTVCVCIKRYLSLNYSFINNYSTHVKNDK